MAVAAYVSLLSLTHALHNLHYRAPFQLPRLDINHVESLDQTVSLLLEFVELHSETETPELEGWWRHVAKAAFEAEEIIDFHVVNLLYLRSVGEPSDAGTSTFCDDIQRMISKFDAINKRLPEIHEDCNKSAAFLPDVAPPSTTSSSAKDLVVGFDEHVVRIKDQLTRNKGVLQILPIVGMGGIGKTTLARCVYDDPYVVDCFDRRIWLTISQDFSVKEILIGLLDVEKDEEVSESSVHKLGEKLHKELFGRKYLIVMDDVWSAEAWDALMRYFPDNANGSRILVTTRLLDVATYLGSLDHYPLSFLDQDSSWNLFCQIIFATGECPYPELVKIGREIARSCRGLPLEISVIGRLLASSNMTQKYWALVAKNISLFGNLEDNEHCLKVLSLSYKSLSINLKACFLYLRVFREDETILDNDLIKRWVAEGFIKPEGDKSLEEIANQYLQDLIRRNLIYVREDSTCGVHDLLWDLCVRESEKEGFIQSPKVMKCYPRNAHHCRLCGCWLSEDYDRIGICQRSVRFPPSSQDDGPFSCNSCQRKYSHITRIKLAMAMNFRGLGVDHDNVCAFELPSELRLLDFSRTVWDFQMIHLLWNLHTLNLISCHILPPELWEMPQLRHIRIDHEAFLANPVASRIEGKDFIVLKNLQTLVTIKNFKFTQEVVDRVPNLKRLCIRYLSGEYVHPSMKQSCYSLCNLVQLQKLEFLSVNNALENIDFPNSLKRLILFECLMAWEDMSIIGSLPVLEVLELRGGIKGSEWSPVEGEFVRLKRLKIEGTHLKYWKGDSIHFPVLEMLLLWGLKSLEGIPLGIGDIPTLQVIDVLSCNNSVIESAQQIMEDQREMGNETLRLVC